MNTLKWTLVGLVGLGALFFAGAWKRPAAPASTGAIKDFLPQPIQLASGTLSPSLDPSMFLRAACAAYHPEKTPWMRTTLWQQMTIDAPFEAQGRLQRGPGGCARLQMIVEVRGKKSRRLVVADGQALAECTLPAEGEERVETNPMPGNDKALTPQICRQLQDLFLREKGCGGPHAFLEETGLQLKEVILETGLYKGDPVYRLQGWLLPIMKQLPTIQVTLFFHPETLWLKRVEKRLLTQEGVAILPFLQMEFRDPVVDQPLSRAECERTFSFDPGAKIIWEE